MSALSGRRRPFAVRFTVTTVGCKVNQYETEALAALLGRFGGRRIDPLAPTAGGQADLVAVNTCCVTATAAAKSRRAIRRAIKRHRAADVFIFGCYATQAGPALRRLARDAGSTGRIHVAGHRDDVAACVQECAAPRGDRAAAVKAGPDPAGHASPNTKGATKPSQTLAGTQPGSRGTRDSQPSPAGPVGNEGLMRAGPSQFPVGLNPSTTDTSTTIKPRGGGHVKSNVGTSALGPVESFAGRQRAFVKVQDGCDAFCSYCVVPHLRPRPWWRPAEEILREVKTLAGNGHKEIVLCGVFLGAYGRETTSRRRWQGHSRLPELLRRVSATEGLWRVRLSSLHPGDVTEELLEVFGDRPGVAPHLHLPLQSGSAEILRRMGRHYSPDDFLDAVRRFRQTVVTPAVTTDIMVGFPGETDEDFAQTLRVAREAGFGKIHVFPFSARRETAAWQWRREAPPSETIKDRCRRLAALERESAEAFRRQFLGRTVEALVVRPNSKTPPGCARGLTDRYIEVTFPANGQDLAGQVMAVQVTGLAETHLTGIAH